MSLSPNGMRPSTNLEVKRYFLALTNPFHPDATGAKSTVFNYRDTSVRCIRWKAVVFTRANMPIQVILQPNPCFYGHCSVNTSPAYASMQNLLGPVQIVQATGTAGMNGALVDQDRSPITSLPIIADSLTNFRVVGGGYKVRSLLGANQTQVVATHVPVLVQNSDLSYQDVQGAPPGSPNNLYSNNSANYWMPGGAGSDFVQQSIFGMNIDRQSLLTLPDCRNFTSFDVQMNEFCYNFQPVSPEAFEFHDLGTDQPKMTNNSGASVGPTDVLDWDFSNGTVARPSRRGATDVAGWSGGFLQAVTASGGELSSFEIEYILHVEGFPRSQGSVGRSTGGVSTPPDYVLSLVQSAKNSFIQTSYDLGLPQAAGRLGARAVKAGSEWALRSLVNGLVASTGSLPRMLPLLA